MRNEPNDVLVHVSFEVNTVTKILPKLAENGDGVYDMIDSGAGGAAISDSKMFHAINPAPGASICFGNGLKIPIAGRGTISIGAMCMKTMTVHTVYAFDAFYVPTQPLNILTVHAFYQRAASSEQAL